MPNRISHGRAGVLIALLSGLMLTQAAAQTPPYPAKQITMIVPTNAGGVTDQIGRAYAQGMAKALGQSVVVENKGGANGVLGAAMVAKAAPDGYTLCFCYSGPVALAKATMPGLPYNIDKDFTPVTRVYDLIPFIAVPIESKASTLADLIAAAKAQPGGAYGHTGVGGALHLGFEQFKQAAGVDFTAVAYAGENPMVPDLITGRLEVGLLSPLFAKAQAGAGKVRLLASMGTPSPLPGVPTVASAGFPGFHVSTWTGIFLPAGTPTAVMRRVYDAVQAASRSADVRERLASAGLTPVVDQTPEQFKEFVDHEKARWAEVVKKMGGLPNQ